MNSKELKEKISEISNSEFPLIDFFNDIGWLEGIKWFNTEKAYEDIEKIYNVFVYYRDKVKQLEKENKELNRQLDVFFNKLDKNTIRAIDLISYDLQDENTKLKKSIEILKVKKIDKFELKFSYSVNEYNIMARNSDFDELTKEEFELFKEILGDDR